MIQRIGTWRKRQADGGFTLIELLVVIVILGILAGVVVFAVGGVKNRGEGAAYAADANILRTAEEAYFANNGQYADIPTLVAKGFLAPGNNVGNLTSKGNSIELGSSGPGGAPNSSFAVVCGTNGSTPPGGCGAGDTIARGGTLVVGGTFAMTPTAVSNNSNGSNHAYWETLYNGLITLDEAGNPSPELAKEVPTVANGGILDNGATYILKLRNDVFWHDSLVTTTGASVGGNTNPTGAVQQFTAADVKFSFEKVLLRFHSRARNMAPALVTWDPSNCIPPPTVPVFPQVACAYVASIDVIDNFTVRFRFTNPYAPFLKQLNVTEAAMVPAHSYLGSLGLAGSNYDIAPSGPTDSGSPKTTTIDTNKIGTGPFMYAGLNSPQAGDAKAIRNPTYWKTGLPYLDAIVIRPITTDATRYAALLNGDVDWLWDVPNPSVADLNTRSSFKTAPTQALGGGPNSIDQLVYNLTESGIGTVVPLSNVPTDTARYGQIGGSNPTLTAPAHPILGNVNVRKAIFEGINRGTFLNPGRNNIGQLADAPISSQLPQHATDITFPSFNQGDADLLLNAAGWNGARTTVGTQTNIRTALNHPNEFNPDPRLQVDDGDALTIRFLYGNAVYTSRAALMRSDLQAIGVNLETELDATNANARVFTHRNFDMYVLNYAQGYDPHVGVRRQYHSDQVSTTGTPNNSAGYKNLAVDLAFDNAAKTLDPVARFNLYHAAQVQIATDLPYMWMIETPNVRGYTTKCKGFNAWTGQFAESGSCSKLR